MSQNNENGGNQETCNINKNLEEKEEMLSNDYNKENELKESQNENNKEFYVKHLLNEIKKYETCAKSYKAENEALKEKMKLLNTKMTIKDKKLEEITKLFKKNDGVIEKKEFTFEVFYIFEKKMSTLSNRNKRSMRIIGYKSNISKVSLKL